MNNEYSVDMVFKTKKKVERRDKKIMKKAINILGTIIIIVSMLLGLYVGLWLLFVGGIIQIANAINPINTLQIGLGILKIIFASPVGWMIGFLGTLIGVYLRDWRYHE